MIKAVLFDFDNTLILFDEQDFFKAYLPRIIHAFNDLMPPEIFRERIISASQALLKNDGRISNVDYFMKMFSSGFEDRQDQM